MLLWLGESPVTFLWCWLMLFFILLLLFFIHFVLHFCCCSSFIAFQRYPSPFRGLSPDFYTRFVLSSQPIAGWFIKLSFSTFPRSSFHSFTTSATVLSGHFLPTGVFYLTLLHWHFPYIHQGLTGARQLFLEVFRALYWSSKHRPGPSVSLIHSNPQSSNSERFIFNLMLNHLLKYNI